MPGEGLRRAPEKPPEGVTGPAITRLLERYGSPRALRRASRRRLVEVIRPKAPRMAALPIDEVFDALDEQTVVVTGLAPSTS
ncbi:hypothetical protein Sgleb_75880 [Streptomyces glebosus]|uniref:Uncharacterized protein n=1 Tax=Streptomyces glebosus TaxID=249580 RepID=A0A640TAN0_9ACTN|nr:hypothetical protein Sgleb_75880 [Streptomyces glebosus]